MAVSLKKIVSGSLLTTSLATYYTCPASTRAKITHATATNQDASAITIRVHLIASGGSAGDDTMVIKDLSIAAGATAVLSGIVGHVIEAGGFIQALASTGAKVAFHVSGLEVS